jgi:hypothetical protein
MDTRKMAIGEQPPAGVARFFEGKKSSVCFIASKREGRIKIWFIKSAMKAERELLIEDENVDNSEPVIYKKR